MNIKLTINPDFVAQVTLPPSKSVVNRELLINALCSMHDERPDNDTLSLADDIQAMQRGLAAQSGEVVDVDGAGTALRFLTAYWATCEGCEVTLTGNRRLRERPIAPLVDALRTLGADITYVDCVGCAPLRIVGRRLRGGHVTMPAGVSSQFVSALLMIAPVIGGMELELVGDIVSRPYIDMTLAIMQRHGVTAQWHDNVIILPDDNYMPAPSIHEGDWSAAAFWLALQALLPQAHITLHGLHRDSVQGDSRIITIMEQMGMQAHWHADGALTMDMGAALCCCCSTFADLMGTPDLAPVLVVALCLMGRPFRITGLRTLRLKESDRREALRQELLKLGYDVTLEGDDALSWHFATCPAQDEPVIDPHGDHRIAMAMALAAVKHPGLTIEHAEVVAKSYPTFWQTLLH